MINRLIISAYYPTPRKEVQNGFDRILTLFNFSMNDWKSLLEYIWDHVEIQRLHEYVSAVAPSYFIYLLII